MKKLPDCRALRGGPLPMASAGALSLLVSSPGHCSCSLPQPPRLPQTPRLPHLPPLAHRPSMRTPRTRTSPTHPPRIPRRSNATTRHGRRRARTPGHRQRPHWCDLSPASAATLSGLSAGSSSAQALAPGRSAWTPSGGTLGMDVSSYQQNVDWASAWAAGSPIRLREGHRRCILHQPLLRAAVQRLSLRRYGARRLPLRQPRTSSGADQARYFVQNGGGWTSDGQTLPGLLDIEFNPYPAYGNTCYNMTPGTADRLDPRLRGHLPRPDRPRTHGVHRNLLVVPVRELPGIRFLAAAPGQLLHRRGSYSCRLERLRHLAVHRLGPVRG